jgi:hypothetical protein
MMKFWDKVEDYLFDPAMASKVYNCWGPVKYRIIPDQLKSDEPGTELFEEYVKAIPLHSFDVD